MTAPQRAQDAPARDPGRASLLVVAAVVAVALVWALRSIVTLVAFSVLIAYALDPLVTLFSRVRLPRGARLPRAAAAALVILGGAVAVGWGLAVIIPQLVSETAAFFAGLPQDLKTLEVQLSAIARDERLGGAGEPLARQLEAGLPQMQSALLGWVGRLFGNVLQLGGLVVLPVLAFYLLAERDEVRSSFMRFVPEEAHPQLRAVGRALDRALASYVRGQAVVCAISGAVMSVALIVIGIPHALMLGLLVGLGEILPFLGFWIAAAAITLVGLGESPLRAAIGVGAYILSNTLIGLLVTPRVMSRHLKMHPFVVTVSVLAGAELLGPAGVLLALPAAAIAQALVQEFAPRRAGKKESSKT